MSSQFLWSSAINADIEIIFIKFFLNIFWKQIKIKIWPFKPGYFHLSNYPIRFKINYSRANSIHIPLYGSAICPDIHFLTGTP